MTRAIAPALVALLVLPLTMTLGCSDDSANDESGSVGADEDVPLVYAFDSRFTEGSSVAYSGQTFRQVLVHSLKEEMSAIQDEIAAQTVFEDGEVAARLYFYYRFDSASSGDIPHLLSTSPLPLQSTWNDISSDKDLVAKVAGNDETGQHKDWSSEMVGWDAAANPDDLIVQWIEAVDDLAVAYSLQPPMDPNGAQIEKFYISPEGLDYQQLIQKFLLGAVNFSQGADDYLDDDIEGKGLLSDNTEPVEGKPYTALEHQWDEGFGYWGGAVNYLDYTDDELAAADGRAEYVNGYNDLDGDGAIDLGSEFNFGASVNAAKRDLGAASSALTDMSHDTMTAFLTGRHIIAMADGALSEAQLDALREQRDAALLGWEQALAATAIHYFNDCIKDTNAAEYSFTDHTKHWGELKGFLLSLQFNPHSPLGDETLAMIHDLVGTAPVFPSDPNVTDYLANLLIARDLLAAAYGFDAANIGDENGENGW